MGHLDQSPIDTFPGRHWLPHTAVTGVDGGHDTNVRALADASARLTGTLIGVSDTRLVTAGNANQILDAAGVGYLSFVHGARACAPAIG